ALHGASPALSSSELCAPRLYSSSLTWSSNRLTKIARQTPIPPITEIPYLSRQVSAGGLPLHALERGPAPAPHLLFLHACLDHGHVFDWVCDALPREWHLVCLDFRGHGFSGHLPAGALYNFTDYLADVEATLDELRLSPVHLIGHSMGGGVAFAYAAARPERV